MVVPRARRQLGGMGGLNYLLLLRCFKIVPILGLVVYTIALLVPSMVQPFNIRGVQEAATSLKANEAPGYASSGSDAAVKNAVVHIGPHKTGSTTIQEHSLALQTHLLSDGYGMPYAHTFTDGKKIHEPWCNQVNVATCFILMPTILKRDIFHAATTCYKPDWT